jgi:hypothetical protein
MLALVLPIQGIVGGSERNRAQSLPQTNDRLPSFPSVCPLSLSAAAVLDRHCSNPLRMIVRQADTGATTSTISPHDSLQGILGSPQGIIKIFLKQCLDLPTTDVENSLHEDV